MYAGCASCQSRQHLHELFADLSYDSNFQDKPDHQELIVPREEVGKCMYMGNPLWHIDYTRCNLMLGGLKRLKSCMQMQGLVYHFQRRAGARQWSHEGVQADVQLSCVLWLIICQKWSVLLEIWLLLT